MNLFNFFCINPLGRLKVASKIIGIGQNLFNRHVLRKAHVGLDSPGFPVQGGSGFRVPWGKTKEDQELLISLSPLS